MITLEDLNQAIKECEGQRSPNANTALKLAAFYTIKKELFPQKDEPPVQAGYSFAMPPGQETVGYSSSTDFGTAVEGKNPDDVLSVMDDLITLLQSAQPRLARKILEKIEDLD